MAGMLQVMNSTIGSSLPSGASSFIAKYFDITNQEQLVLPISMYLIGYVLGPLFWGPMSEAYGRKKPMLTSFTLYTIFMMASAVAPTFPALLVFRLLAGIMASAPNAITAGLFADIHNDPTKRGRTMAIFMAVSFCSPPITSTTALTYYVVYNAGANHGAVGFRLCLCRQLAMELLDRIVLCLCHTSIDRIFARDLRTDYSSTESEAVAQKDRKSKHSFTVGPAEP